jgi:beta-galactosidase
MRAVQFSVIVGLMIMALATVAQSALAGGPRSRELIDDNWRFALGHAWDPAKDFDFTTAYFYNAKAGAGDGAAAADFDDRGWRVVNLPHDWAVELPFDPQGDTGHGAKRVGRPYPESSVGWYRRSLDIPATDLGRRISVEFDGAFRDAQVFLNGHDVGRCASGYDGFRCDLTDVLNYGGTNILAVRLDATLREGWFYEGAGIYRHVWLTKTGPLHIAQYGTFVTAESVSNISDDALTAGSANLKMATTLQNESAEDASFSINQAVLDAERKEVGSGVIPSLTVGGGDSREFELKLKIANPRLWSPEQPAMYTLVTTVQHKGEEVDRYETPFGIRTLRFDKDQGFFLNGKHVLIKGTCNHQDHAGVGVAVPDALQAFRVRRLLEMGSNALRTSHNPPAPGLLDACDRLGMLVLDENRRTGTAPQAMDGLKQLILRDRNHPSVFLWSLGNEEWVIESNIIGQRVVAAQRAVAHKLDPSRLVTDAISGGWGNGTSNSVDVMGFNYYTHGNVDDYHAKHPDQPCIGSEEGSCTTTRGAYVRDDATAELAAYGDTAPSWAATHEHWVNFYASRPFVAGAFVWTGFDYRGETTPFGWPGISSQFGILDTCGFAKDAFYYYQSCWSDKPMVHLLPHWNWPGKEGQPIDVRSYSNCDEVELLLNGKSIGREPQPRLKQIKWTVKYAPGTLTAIAYKGGKEAARDVVQTSGGAAGGDAAGIQLIPDRAAIRADGRDLSVITVRAIDDQGRPVPTAHGLVHFELNGPGKIIGVGNGDPACHEPDVFVDKVQAITVSKWKSKPMTDAGDPPEAAEDFDDSKWASAAPDDEFKKTAEVRIYRGIVEIPGDGATSAAAFVSHAGKDFQLFINGKRVEDSSYLSGHLRAGKNTVAVVARVEKGKNIGLVIRRVTPALPWQRSLFNGLAQVIVQSDQAPGQIILTASGDGIAKTAITITTDR